MNVVVTGGGTAGHVFPALATAVALRDDHGAEVTFIGGVDGQEARLVPAAGFPFLGLEVAPAQSRLSRSSIHAVRLAMRGARACRGTVAAADVVVSVGGFASAPAALAARRTRRPLLLIVPDAVPGLVNRIAARWADAAATTFAGAAARLPSTLRVERTGNPIRAEIAAVPAHRERLRVEARAAFDLEPDRRTVLVVGGSQGARHLDEAVADALPLLRDRADLQLLVATGRAHVEIVAGAVDPDARLRVRPVGFVDRMDLALAIADLAVARAGASYAELAACGLPAIVVPYPYATENHQEANARELVEAGCARMVLDADLTGSALASGILDLMGEGATLEAMRAAAAAWARPDAAARIARLALEVAGSRG